MWGTESRSPMGLAPPRMRGSAARRTRAGKSARLRACAEIQHNSACSAGRRTDVHTPHAPPADRAAPVALPRRRPRPPGSPPRRLAHLGARAGRPGHRALRSLPVRVKKHGSLLLRELSADEMALQHNKVVNLRLASARTDGVVIRPGETFSFNKVVGNCTRRKGYVVGMRLSNGEARAGRRRRHLPAGEPAALDVPALAAHRGRAVRAQLRPVPGQEPGAALGRRLLDRLELRRPRGPQRHRRDLPAPHLGRRAAPARRAAGRPAGRPLLQGGGARGGVRQGR